MKQPLPLRRDSDDDQVLKDVAESGCHVVGVLADERGPAFAYSIGLFHNYDHPEILIFGLSYDLMHRIINGLRDNIEQGGRFVPGSGYPDIVEGFNCEFLTVHRSHYAELFGYGQWFYGGNDFPAIQCIWPDTRGIFPWELGFDPKFKRLQPTHKHEAL